MSVSANILCARNELIRHKFPQNVCIILPMRLLPIVPSFLPTLLQIIPQEIRISHDHSFALQKSRRKSCRKLIWRKKKQNFDYYLVTGTGLGGGTWWPCVTWASTPLHYYYALAYLTPASVPVQPSERFDDLLLLLGLSSFHTISRPVDQRESACNGEMKIFNLTTHIYDRAPYRPSF